MKHLLLIPNLIHTLNNNPICKLICLSKGNNLKYEIELNEINRNFIVEYFGSNNGVLNTDQEDILEEISRIKEEKNKEEIQNEEAKNEEIEKEKQKEKRKKKIRQKKKMEEMKKNKEKIKLREKKEAQKQKKNEKIDESRMNSFSEKNHSMIKTQKKEIKSSDHGILRALDRTVEIMNSEGKKKDTNEDQMKEDSDTTNKNSNMTSINENDISDYIIITIITECVLICLSLCMVLFM